MDTASSVTVERQIAASPERVWDLITNIEGWPNTISSIVAVERLDGGAGFGEGTRWRETRRVLKREGTEEMWVSAIDPGHSYTVEAENHGVRYISTFTVVPAAGGSRLVLGFSGHATGRQGFLSRFLARLGMKAVRQGLEKDLADIARAAER